MSTVVFQTWTAGQMAGFCGGELRGDPEAKALGIANDTRRMGEDELFVALRGERDGHAYIDAARDAGGRVFLVERAQCPEPLPGEAMIVVDDTLAGLATLGRAIWRAHRAARPQRHTLAITGSNGKTTSKDLAGALLEDAYPGQVFVTQGNLNSHIGLPMSLASLATSHRFVVLEMGASRPGDIEHLVRIAPIERALVTSIAPAHLEGFGDRGAVVNEKGRIFAGTDPAQVAVFPETETDSGLVPSQFAGQRRPFGQSPKSVVQVIAYSGSRPARAVVNVAPPVSSKPENMHLELGLAGLHNALNAAGVVAALWDWLPADEKAERIQRVVATFEGPAGRLVTRVGQCDATVLDDSYNANPGSVEAALQVLGEHRGRRWAILGDMLELGAEASALHEAIGRAAATAGCELVWAVGQHAADVLRGADEAGVPSLAGYANAGLCAQAASQSVKRGDVILVKGSRGVGLEAVVEAISTRPDDDGGAP